LGLDLLKNARYSCGYSSSSFSPAATGFGAEAYATNRDGSVLYFSSSLRQKGTTQYCHSKMFVWEQGKGVRLFEQRASDMPVDKVNHPFQGSRYYLAGGEDAPYLSFLDRSKLVDQREGLREETALAARQRRIAP
jgi:hypothetical protein